MSCTDDTAWLEARIEKTRALIEAYEDAILAISSGAIQQYSLDTSQSRQTVTKQNIGSLRTLIDTLENRLATLQARLCGGSVRVVPGW